MYKNELSKKKKRKIRLKEKKERVTTIIKEVCNRKEMRNINNDIEKRISTKNPAKNESLKLKEQ